MIKIFNDQRAASKRWRKHLLPLLEEAVDGAGRFTVALTGGSSPQTLYKILRGDPYRQKIPWQNTYVFWGDERAVPFDDDRSNAKMGFEILLNHVPVPADQIYRVNGEIAPDNAAEEYEIC
jgi:6-phosphogluconolactonase